MASIFDPNNPTAFNLLGNQQQEPLTINQENYQQPNANANITASANGMTRNQKIGDMLAALSDAFAGRDVAGRAMQRAQAFRKQAEVDRQRQEALRKQELIASLPEDIQRIYGVYGADAAYKAQYGTASKGKIIKGADGFNYFADTGERVLPNVGTKPYEITTTDIISAQKDERKTFQATNKGVKNFQQLLDAAQAADGAASYALMIKFIKQLDDSVVRDSEVATFGGFQGALTNLKNQISKTSGEGFTPDVKANMINLASQTANRLVNDYAVYRRGKEISYGSIGFNPNTVFAGLDFNLGGLDLTKTYTPSDFVFIELE